MSHGTASALVRFPSASGCAGVGSPPGRHHCCDSTHPFDLAHVREHRWPDTWRCLIIGESPAAPGAAYFYDPIQEPDPVLVRRLLLRALTRAKFIAAPTLEALKEAGFAFDHAIRCQLPMEEIK